MWNSDLWGVISEILVMKFESSCVCILLYLSTFKAHRLLCYESFTATCSQVLWVVAFLTGSVSLRLTFFHMFIFFYLSDVFLYCCFEYFELNPWSATNVTLIFSVARSQSLNTECFCLGARIWCCFKCFKTLPEIKALE